MSDPYEEIASKCSELRFICDNFAPEMHLDDIIHHFRFLRNICTSGINFQSSVAKQLECIGNVLKLLINMSDNSENLQHSIRIGIQVLGNMIVSNTENQSLVWRNCAYILSHVLNSEDENAANYAAMVVYNIILGLGQEELMNYMDLKIIKGLLSSACNGSEFGHFAVLSLLGIPNWLVESYSFLASHEKYYILDLISDHITKPHEKNVEHKKEIHNSAIRFISSDFCAHSDKLFDTRVSLESDSKIAELFESASPCEYTKLLDVLASAASNEAYLHILQSDGPLLVHSIYLLKSIHASGKIAEEKGDLNHPFTPIKNISTSESSKLVVDLHPAYGFKRSLIQLIGNLAWKNKEIQNKILELECVPLILESCIIDEKNPFITQWAIMAIRNLCDGNLQVQQLIAGLNRQGVVSSQLIHEMGLTLHDPGDPSQKISIVPLPRPLLINVLPDDDSVQNTT